MGRRAYRAVSADGPVGRLSAGDVGRPRGTDYGGHRLPPPPGRCGIDFMRMVSTMLGRRVGAGVVGLALALVIGLSGCAQGNTPTEYNTLTQQNFVELCTNYLYTSSGEITAIDASTAATLDTALKATETTIASDVKGSSESSCLCMYAVFVDQMSIGDFTTLNSDLKSDPEKTWNGVSSEIKDALTKCAEGTAASTTTTVA
jgi:hypothetical protein